MSSFVFAPRGRGEETGEEVKIVAVDLQAMAPLPGVTQIQGDITKVMRSHLLLLTSVRSVLTPVCVEDS